MFRHVRGEAKRALIYMRQSPTTPLTRAKAQQNADEDKAFTAKNALHFQTRLALDQAN